jgi:hypothetical protein
MKLGEAMILLSGRCDCSLMILAVVLVQASDISWLSAQAERLHEFYFFLGLEADTSSYSTLS